MRKSNQLYLLTSFFAASMLLPAVSRAQAIITETPDDKAGQAVYAKYCASCHDQVSPRIPARDALQKMSSARILRTMDFGLMMSIAYPLKREEREAVAAFLGTRAVDAAPPASAVCSRHKVALSGPQIRKLERMEPGGRQCAVSNCSGFRPHGCSGAEPETEMGIRFCR